MSEYLHVEQPFVLTIWRNTIEMGEPTFKEIEAHDEAHDRAHDEAHEDLTDSERKLLECCLNQPRNTQELLHFLGYRTRTGNFKRSLTRLLDAALLEMTIPDKPRSKNQKYRLTDRGRQVLKDSGETP